jgi:hypothetical protein
VRLRYTKRAAGQIDKALDYVAEKSKNRHRARCAFANVF